MYSFDQVCDPASMFQDTLGLSEFILGEFVEESSDNFMDAMFEKNDKDTSYENAMDEEDYQVNYIEICTNFSPWGLIFGVYQASFTNERQIETEENGPKFSHSNID